MTRFMLRNSERQAWKTCRHRWRWTYVDGKQSAVAPTALRFGDLIHQALAPYYKPGKKRGPHPVKTFTKLYHAQVAEKKEMGFDVFSDENWVGALDLGSGMLEGYVDKYRAADSEYQVISSEQTFQLRIRHPMGFVFWIVGTFDGVWLHLPTGKIVFKEFKTAASINLDGLPMDEQAGLYWTYGPKWMRENNILKPKQLPSAILYTFLRKAIPNPDAHYDAEGHVLNKPSKDALRDYYAETGRRFPKGTGGKGAVLVDDMIADLGDKAWLLGEISMKQPSPYFERVPVYRDEPDRQNMHQRVLDEVGEIRAAREGLMPTYKNPGPLHMPNCRGCAVRDACEVHETGGDFQPILDFSMIDWDPYAAHELAERR